jgi:hypothetical protein
VGSAPDSESSEALSPVVQDLEHGAAAAAQVSQVAAGQASQVGGEVSTAAEKLVDDAKAQLRQRAETQLGQLAEGLNVLNRQTRALAQGRLDEAGPLVDYVREGADRLGDLTERIHKGGLDGVVSDIKRFARMRPLVFLSGSALAGLAVGRLVRNEAAAVQGRRVQKESTGEETAGASAALGPDAALSSDRASADAVSAPPAVEEGQ